QVVFLGVRRLERRPRGGVAALADLLEEELADLPLGLAGELLRELRRRVPRRKRNEAVGGALPDFLRDLPLLGDLLQRRHRGRRLPGVPAEHLERDALRDRVLVPSERAGADDLLRIR